jgi:hypothetical protein
MHTALTSVCVRAGGAPCPGVESIQVAAVLDRLASCYLSVADRTRASAAIARANGIARQQLSWETASEPHKHLSA